MININLIDLQKQLYNQLGFKVDVYHSEPHRGILAVRHNAPLTPSNVIFKMSY